MFRQSDTWNTLLPCAGWWGGRQTVRWQRDPGVLLVTGKQGPEPRVFAALHSRQTSLVAGEFSLCG